MSWLGASWITGVTKVLRTTLQVIGIGRVVEENGGPRYRSFGEGHPHVLSRLNAGPRMT